jgi:hypothetical protein
MGVRSPSPFTSVAPGLMLQRSYDADMFQGFFVLSSFCIPVQKGRPAVNIHTAWERHPTIFNHTRRASAETGRRVGLAAGQPVGPGGHPHSPVAGPSLSSGLCERRRNQSYERVLPF